MSQPLTKPSIPWWIGSTATHRSYGGTGYSLIA